MSPEFQLTSPEKLTYDDIARLDPLDLDGIMPYLPELNREGNADGIHRVLVGCIETSRRDVKTTSDAVAALRDIDFLASSLIKHNIDPLINTPGLEDEMIRLGRLGNMVPRGTVFTYAVINPKGERGRSFTGTYEEAEFIEAVRNGTLALDQAVVSMSKQSLTNDGALGISLYESAAAMDIMVDSIVEVRRKVSPEFFSNEMRPYFESLTIGGNKLTGSGGAQMQLLALDRMLWGNGDDDTEYQGFYEENNIYLTPMQQDALAMFLEHNNQQTIVGWLESHPEGYDNTREGALELLKKIKKFRYPHRRVAQDNFKIRPADSVGSGSYKPDILDILIAKTELALTRITRSEELIHA
jgi:hypothetical protein